MHHDSRALILPFPSSFHTHKSPPPLGMLGLMVVMMLHRLGFSFMKPPALSMVPMMVLLGLPRLTFPDQSYSFPMVRSIVVASP